MVRLALVTVEKRIERFERRARLLNVPPLVMTCTGEGDEADRLAYATADEAERSALEDKYLGDLPPHPDPLGIRAIIVRSAERPPDDDDEDDLPVGMTAEQVAEAKRQRDRVSAEMALDAELQAQRQQAAAELDPRDPNPEGPDEEILYVDERSGYPVSRREHRERRELARPRSGATTSSYVVFQKGER